jgi:hypothetical protein
MIKRAELRMADEIDAAQMRGEGAEAEGTINPGTIQGVRHSGHLTGHLRGK